MSCMSGMRSGVPVAVGGGGPPVTPAALTTGAADANVTITLGGTPATALLQATSITIGWSSTLAIARGGTGAGTAAAAATALGVGTGDSPQFTAVNVGAATDTTLARQGAAVLAVEGKMLYATGTVTLADGATPALDASLGSTFTLAATGNQTIAIPSNPQAGQKIVIAHTASGGARTLALNAGTGGFRFGTDVTALTATSSGLTDYIGCIYNATANKWDVIAYSKGY